MGHMVSVKTTNYSILLFNAKAATSYNHMGMTVFQYIFIYGTEIWISFNPILLFCFALIFNCLKM